MQTKEAVLIKVGKHSSRMRTTHFFGFQGWFAQPPPVGRPPAVGKTPWMQTHRWRQTLPCEQNDRRFWKYYLAPNFVGGMVKILNIYIFVIDFFILLSFASQVIVTRRSRSLKDIFTEIYAFVCSVSLGWTLCCDAKHWLRGKEENLVM